jgi:hypothetical protein
MNHEAHEAENITADNRKHAEAAAQVKGTDGAKALSVISTEGRNLFRFLASTREW